MATYGPGRGRSSKQTTRSRSASASSRARTDRSDRSGAVDRTERSDRVDATGRVRRGSGAASADIREAIRWWRDLPQEDRRIVFRRLGLKV